METKRTNKRKEPSGQRDAAIAPMIVLPWPNKTSGGNHKTRAKRCGKDVTCSATSRASKDHETDVNRETPSTKLKAKFRPKVMAVSPITKPTTPEPLSSRGRRRGHSSMKTSRSRRRLEFDSPYIQTKTMQIFTKGGSCFTRKVKNYIAHDQHKSLECNEKEEDEWCKKEQELFRERALSFINSMRLVQGNRGFMGWKGSVVDSVVGVFLTQNTADSYSSCAFMSLAAKYPNQDGTEGVDWNAVRCAKPHVISHAIQERGMNKRLAARIKMMCTHLLETTHTVKYDSRYQQSRAFRQWSGGGSAVVRCADGCRWCTDGGPAVVRQWSGGGPTVVRCADGCKWCTDGGPAGVRWWSGGGPMVVRWWRWSGGGPMCRWVQVVHRRWSGGGPMVVRWWVQVVVRWVQKFLESIHDKNSGLDDLEWLRKAKPGIARDFFSKVYGLGIKSIECVRLLTLRQRAFPVDRHIARIVVRLGWVPLHKLPDDLAIHQLQEYPMMKSVQEYLSHMLGDLDAETLYELHYQMITFGKVFCTKKKPNCNSCPLKKECRHFASAYSSSRPDPDPLVSVTIRDIEDLCLGPASQVKVKKQKLLKNAGRSRSRTQHQVYELPESHPLVQMLDKRDCDDKNPYLLAIWPPGMVKEEEEEMVFGTYLVPCRTATRGSFPLDGTFFQINEVFADDETSRKPLVFSRKLLTDLTKKTLICGTSISAIFEGTFNSYQIRRPTCSLLLTDYSIPTTGLSTQEIQDCFLKGYVCIRGFSRQTRTARPLPQQFHPTGKGKQTNDDAAKPPLIYTYSRRTKKGK
ncbi:hypothetical protein LXL04_015823 [Taraxacum kok-saghyz]